ncbi:MAG: TetR family transcriptional regulator [Lysobacterales bacterium]|jgi:AcrR family transcriptional regulator|nr:MAG: TetR family transcriptional regulator [Xanthomonadales bacterium]
MAIGARAERSRLGPEDWVEAALALIAEQGLQALTVEALARRLRVTKGSFYWHFPSREALLEAALARWEAREVEEVLGPLFAIADPRERLRALFRRTSREIRAHRVFAALMRAVDHPKVASVVERVSRRRLDWLFMAFLAAGLPRREALHRARLCYAAYLGFLQMSLELKLPKLSPEDYEAYVDHTIATLIPGG